MLDNIKTVACLGTGTMGHGIAFLAARAGYSVRMFGRSEKSIDRGMASIDRVVAFYIENGLLTADEGRLLKGRITGVTSLEDAAAGADMVTESVAEVLEVKQQVFADMERFCKPGAMLTANSSSLRPTDISAKLRNPENFLNVHFCTPPYLMPAVEICPGEHTRPEFMDLAAGWVESIGNLPVRLNKDVPGMIINRIQVACLREALYMVEQGWADAETVDRAVVYSLGWRYAQTGPLESADMGGLDIFHHAIDQVAPSLGKAQDAGPLLKAKVERGELGLKSGKGLYDWPPERVAARRGAREGQLLELYRKLKGK